MSPRFALGIKTFCSLTKGCVFLATVTRRQHCNSQTFWLKSLLSDSLKKRCDPAMEPVSGKPFCRRLKLCLQVSLKQDQVKVLRFQHSLLFFDLSTIYVRIIYVEEGKMLIFKRPMFVSSTKYESDVPNRTLWILTERIHGARMKKKPSFTQKQLNYSYEHFNFRRMFRNIIFMYKMSMPILQSQIYDK